MSEMSSSVLCIITPWESVPIRYCGIVLFYSGLQLQCLVDCVQYLQPIPRITAEVIRVHLRESPR
jgi:hypothetical protein